MEYTVYKLLDKTILYRPAFDGLLFRMGRAIDGTAAIEPVMGELLELAVREGWQGDLWHCLLAQELASSENPFSLTYERRRARRDSLFGFAQVDMNSYAALFALQSDEPAFQAIRHFHHEGKAPSLATRQVMELAQKLAAAKDTTDMLRCLCLHYEKAGLGVLGLGQLFRVEEKDGKAALISVRDCRPVALSDLVGYESQKSQLLENTLAFLRGQTTNNVLLYGDAGTGKSTCIQALANEYAADGLRVIELYKQQFHLIPSLLSQIKNRNYRFILLLDDLSFEENEIEYKQLKAVMEGGGEAKPENVLIYATSNRRKLIKETWADRSDMEHNGDIHRSETMEEKLSLAGRFGLQIFYPMPSFEEYQAIVRALAARSEALQFIDPEELHSIAASWQVRHGSRSGRIAQQLINDLLCRYTKPEESTEG